MKSKLKPLCKLMAGTGISMALAACSNGGESDIGVQPVVAETPMVSAQAVHEQQNIPDSVTQENLTVKQQVDFAIGDLAAKMNMDPHEIVFSGMTPVMWRSGALGCPEPGINYTQALVAGVLIMLRVENKPYRYHAAPGNEPFFCPDERAEPPVPGQGAD